MAVGGRHGAGGRRARRSSSGRRRRAAASSATGSAKGEVRFPDQQTWKTPLQDVGTDTREYEHSGLDRPDRRARGRAHPARHRAAAGDRHRLQRAAHVGAGLDHPALRCRSRPRQRTTSPAGRRSSCRRSSTTCAGVRSTACRRRRSWASRAAPLRGAGAGGHLGHGALSPQRLGPDPGRAAQAGGRAGGLVQDRPELRPRECRPRDRADQVRPSRWSPPTAATGTRATAAAATSSAPPYRRRRSRRCWSI